MYNYVEEKASMSMKTVSVRSLSMTKVNVEKHTKRTKQMMKEN